MQNYDFFGSLFVSISFASTIFYILIRTTNFARNQLMLLLEIKSFLLEIKSLQKTEIEHLKIKLRSIADQNNLISQEIRSLSFKSYPDTFNSPEIESYLIWDSKYKKNYFKKLLDEITIEILRKYGENYEVNNFLFYQSVVEDEISQNKQAIFRKSFYEQDSLDSDSLDPDVGVENYIEEEKDKSYLKKITTSYPLGGHGYYTAPYYTAPWHSEFIEFWRMRLFKYQACYVPDQIWQEHSSNILNELEIMYKNWRSTRYKLFIEKFIEEEKYKDRKS